MKVTVCIPWREQPERIRPHLRVLSFWDHFGFKVVEADSDPKRPFHLAQARNNAIGKARTDVFITCDADTIPDIGAVKTGLDMLDGAGVVYPHNKFRHIPGSLVDDSDLMRAPVDRVYHHSDGGIFMSSKSIYADIGRMDERFSPTWGYEDSAFRCAAETLSTIARVPGVLMSFNHSVDGDRAMDNPNKARYQLYQFCYRKPDLMRELIKQ